MRFLFQCPCCSCFYFMKPNKGQPKVKDAKEVKGAKEEKAEKAE
ncbi:hypothetical protein SLEP1_g46231 [Rubroshorea leprosula]|uniref:Uncharacterized protein n=1 Tax=Rubroshorea leprosula TaxID=152421 RepID=A0AAV5LP64_9ROSI|nr:hypothetical protein SLEP1_g46231 [Rubroshorea leprosula]